MTKGAIGNLINRYKAVLKKCHLINVFGSLAVVSLLVGGATSNAYAMDQDLYEQIKAITTFGDAPDFPANVGDTKRLYFGGKLAEAGQSVDMESSSVTLSSGTLTGEMNAGGLAYGTGANSHVANASITMSGGTLTQMADHPDGDIYSPIRGGGAAFNGGTSVVDNAVINITGGQFDTAGGVTDIMGGGVADSESSSLTKNATINIGNTVSLNSNVAIYGGGDNANVGNATININTDSFYDGRDYTIHGGGIASEDGAVAHVDTTEIHLTGNNRDESEYGEYGYIFGGGEAKNGGLSTVGTSNIIIESGTLYDTMITGGGDVGNHESKNARTYVENSNIKITGGTITNSDIYGGGSVWGDSSNSSHVGMANITVSGGTINGNETFHYDGIYGGGHVYAGLADVDSASININGGEINNTFIYGGGDAENGESNVGKSSITVNDGNIASEIVGGGLTFGQNSKAHVGSTEITINGGNLSGKAIPGYRPHIYGGGQAQGGESNVDSATITINGGVFASDVGSVDIYAGGNSGYMASGGTTNVNESVININNVDMRQSTIFGGGQTEHDNSTSFVEKSTINVNGGSISEIYAGGVGNKASTSLATININHGSVENIYGSGMGFASVDTTNINVKDGTAIGNISGDPNSLKTFNITLSGGNIQGNVTASASEHAQVIIDTNNLSLGGMLIGGAPESILEFTDKVTSFDGSKFDSFDMVNVTGQTVLTGGFTDGNVGKELTIGGAGTTIADVALKSGSLTVKENNLVAEKIDLSGTGTVNVAQNGTLTTLSDQVFSTGLGDNAENLDPSAIKNGINFAGGNLTLNDEFFNLTYANDAAELLKEQSGGNLTMLGTLKSGNLVIGTNHGEEVGNAETGHLSAQVATIALTGGDTVAVNAGNEITLLGNGQSVITSDIGDVTLLVGSETENGAGIVNLGAEKQNAGGVLSGTAVIAEDSKLNVKSGEFSITNIELKKDGILNVADTLTAETLNADSESLITVGENNSAGMFSAANVNLNGARVFLDPIWKDNNTIDEASQVSLGGNEINGLLTVGRNSLLALGDTDNTWAKSMFERSGLSWGQDAVSSALAIKTPQTLVSVGGIKVDGSLTRDNVESQGYAAANKAEFATGSLLMVDASTTASGAIIGNGSSELSVASGAKLYLGNANANQKYTITKDFITNLDGWRDENLVANALIDAKTAVEGDNVVVTTTSKDIRDTYPNIIPVNALNGMQIDTDSADMGVRFLSRAIDTASGYQPANPESTINEVSRAAVTAGVQNTALRLSDAASDTVLNHLSLSFFDTGNTIHQDGVDMWATPMYGNTYTPGMSVSGASVRGNYGGVAFGADTHIGEIAGGKVRAGAAINGGGGKSETSGTATSTENEYNFGGVNLYAGWNLDNLNVIASLGYGIGSHDVKMDLPGSLRLDRAKADVDTGVFTADLRAEYQIKTNWLDILPHAGVRYTSLHTDSYDLKVNGSKLNSVKSDTQNIVQFPIGVTVTKNIDVAGWNVKPQADVSVIPAAGDKKNTTKVSYAGINAWDSVNTRIMDSTSFSGMVGLQAEKGNFALGVNYGVQAGRHETDQRVNVGISWKF